MAKRVLCLLIAIFSLASCSSYSQRATPTGEYIKPELYGDECFDLGDGWVECNLIGDGVARQATFLDTGKESYFLIKNDPQGPTRRIVGPKGPLDTLIIRPGLFDMTGDKVPEIIWPVKNDQTTGLSVVSLTGGPEKTLFEHPRINFATTGGTNSNPVLFLSLPDPTLGIMAIPWRVHGEKMLPDPFGSDRPFSIEITDQRKSAVGKAWRDCFDGIKPRLETSLEGELLESAKTALAFYYWDIGKDAEAASLIIGDEENSPDLSKLLFNKGFWALWRGNTGFAKTLFLSSMTQIGSNKTSECLEIVKSLP
ncbi:MAG TPA: hypothetical protein PLC49_06660 [Caldisericia bacterium]|nr:hypothetical protein [Caldisericia bacterium]HPV87252.1 hypothetical protein [Caldisericia bacterium]